MKRIIALPGYRLDAAKHMWPGDISAILGKTKNSKHGGKPFVFQEVIDLYGSEAIKASDYDHLGTVTEFKFGEYIMHSWSLVPLKYSTQSSPLPDKLHHLLMEERIVQIETFVLGLKMGEIFLTNQVKLKDLRGFGESWGMLAGDKALVFVDNHDNQRGHGGGGNIITFKDSRVSLER
jgi:alpha-amylase